LLRQVSRIHMRLMRLFAPSPRRRFNQTSPALPVPELDRFTIRSLSINCHDLLERWRHSLLTSPYTTFVHLPPPHLPLRHIHAVQIPFFQSDCITSYASSDRPKPPQLRTPPIHSTTTMILRFQSRNGQFRLTVEPTTDIASVLPQVVEKLPAGTIPSSVTISPKPHGADSRHFPRSASLTELRSSSTLRKIRPRQMETLPLPAG
jgi:hypothetical protein